MNKPNKVILFSKPEKFYSTYPSGIYPMEDDILNDLLHLFSLSVITPRQNMVQITNVWYRKKTLPILYEFENVLENGFLAV